MEPEIEFFDAGLQQYGKAILAVSKFEELLLAQLRNMLTSRPVSAASVLTLAGAPAFTKLTGSLPFTYVATSGALASLTSDGTDGVPVSARLELGVWWTPPFESKTGVAVYAGIVGAAWSRRLTKPIGSSAAVYKHRQAAAYLTRDVEADKPFEPLVNELLADLEKAAETQHHAPR